MTTRNFEQSRSTPKQLIAFTVACWLACLAGKLGAQSNYGSFFTQQGAKYGGGLGTQSSSAYLYDKYFYHNKSVSPYANLARRDPLGGTNYYSYVKPEQERRERQYEAQTAQIDQLKKSGRVGGIRYPGVSLGGTGQVRSPAAATPSAYYNHWYGGRKP